MSIELLGLTLGNETISLKEPSSMVITRAWDSPAWQLDITLPHEGALDDLTKIQVKHGTDALFAGLCDEIVRSVDGNGAFVSISARTPGALLCDNEALPKTYTDLTAQAYFNTELKALGFTGLSLPNTTASAATFQLGTFGVGGVLYSVLPAVRPGTAHHRRKHRGGGDADRR